MAGALVLAAFEYALPVPAELGKLSAAAVANILAGTAVAVALIGAIAFREGYAAGLWVSSPLVPGTAAVATVVSYLLLAEGETNKVPAVPFLSVAIGLTAAGVGWALAAFVAQGLARRELADMGAYAELRDRYGQLCARYVALQRAPTVPASRQAQYESALAEARGTLECVRLELFDPVLGAARLRWIMGAGYGTVRRSLHRVEELIIAAEPREAVVGDALHDHLSLTGSTIAGRDALSNRLAAAMRVISDDAARVFFSPTVEPNATSTAEPSEAEAREVLREVRFAINSFRDDRVDGLVRARNRLLWTMLAVGITSYVALVAALLLRVSLDNLVAGIAFYLVAALVGLFNRLRIESSRGSAAEDHGLFLIRLVVAPLLSGIAGVAGVFLVAATAALAADETPEMAKLVAKTYDLGQSQVGLLTAAVFGFAPAQLTTALQKQTERFQRDLELSEPSGGSETTVAADV